MSRGRCEPRYRLYKELCNRSSSTGTGCFINTRSSSSSIKNQIAVNNLDAFEDYWEDASVSLKSSGDGSWEQPLSPSQQIRNLVQCERACDVDGGHGLAASGSASGDKPYVNLRPLADEMHTGFDSVISDNVVMSDCHYNYGSGCVMKRPCRSRSFPPPVASCVTLSIKGGGRFVLKEMDHASPAGFFRAERENGRLRLQLIHHTKEADEEDEDDDESSKDDDEYDEESLKEDAEKCFDDIEAERYSCCSADDSSKEDLSSETVLYGQYENEHSCADHRENYEHSCADHRAVKIGLEGLKDDINQHAVDEVKVEPAEIAAENMEHSSDGAPKMESGHAFQACVETNNNNTGLMETNDNNIEHSVSPSDVRKEASKETNDIYATTERFQNVADENALSDMIVLGGNVFANIREWDESDEHGRYQVVPSTICFSEADDRLSLIGHECIQANLNSSVGEIGLITKSCVVSDASELPDIVRCNGIPTCSTALNDQGAAFGSINDQGEELHTVVGRTDNLNSQNQSCIIAHIPLECSNNKRMQDVDTPGTVEWNVSSSNEDIVPPNLNPCYPKQLLLHQSLSRMSPALGLAMC